MSGKSFKQITQDINQALVGFRKEAAGTMAGFGAMAQAAMAPGTLSELQKELIALAIGVAMRCDGCIGFHTKALVRLGVTREQLNETLERTHSYSLWVACGLVAIAALGAWLWSRRTRKPV